MKFVAIALPTFIAFTRRHDLPGACSTAHRSNRPDHWEDLLLDRSAVKQLSFQNGSNCRQAIHYIVYSVLPVGNRCHFVLLDKDESCLTADLSNTGRPNGPAYSTGEL